MTMTSNNEQEAFSLVIERQQHGASENDIRFAFLGHTKALEF